MDITIIIILIILIILIVGFFIWRYYNNKSQSNFYNATINDAYYTKSGRGLDSQYYKTIPSIRKTYDNSWSNFDSYGYQNYERNQMPIPEYEHLPDAHIYNMNGMNEMNEEVDYNDYNDYGYEQQNLSKQHEENKMYNLSGNLNNQILSTGRGFNYSPKFVKETVNGDKMSSLLSSLGNNEVIRESSKHILSNTNNDDEEYRGRNYLNADNQLSSFMESNANAALYQNSRRARNIY